MSTHIDVHCHSSSKPFMSGIANPSLNMFDSKELNIEHPIYTLPGKPLEQMSNIKLSTQSNFDHLFEGGVRVTFASITPMEKAFTVLNPDTTGLKADLIRTFMGEASNYHNGFISSLAMNALTGTKPAILIMSRIRRMIFLMTCS